ncbi:MAG: GDP-mannose 4,6-dehydratase [Anaerolineae bacterium]|nr:GDP-mannose 4,6-dehydratase [Anaerolineae bacterium]
MITGGAGFIGSHLALMLAQSSDHRIVIVDNFNDYYDPAIKRANVLPLAYSPASTVIEADIRERERMAQIVDKHDITHILHLAGMANVRASIEQSPLYVNVNTLGTVNILEAARQHGVQQVICASTSSVYGVDSPVPFVEDAAAARPLASYPASKRAAEIIGHTYAHLFDLNVTFLRFFNVYGPNGRPDMMPLRVLDAIVRKKEITLYNNGEMRRDWTYIDDIVAGIMAALERPLGYEIINLGCGEPETMNTFVRTLETLTGRRAITRDVPAPPSDPPITYCDNSKARRLLDFDPQVPLAEGLARTWGWYRRKYGL